MDWFLLALLVIGVGVLVKFLGGDNNGRFGGGGGGFFDDFG